MSSIKNTIMESLEGDFDEETYSRELDKKSVGEALVEIDGIMDSLDELTDSFERTIERLEETIETDEARGKVSRIVDQKALKARDNLNRAGALISHIRDEFYEFSQTV